MVTPSSRRKYLFIRGAEGAEGETGYLVVLLLDDDSMAVCGFFLTRKAPRSLSQISRESTKSTKMMAEHENNVWNNCEKRYSYIKLLKNTFEWTNLN